MSKIFKIGAKNLFLMIFGVVFFALSFWLVQPAPKVEAACGVDCFKDSSNNCYIDDTAWTPAFAKVCTINNLIEKNNSSGTATCIGNNGACQANKCPDTSSFNGSSCYIKSLPGSCYTDFSIEATGNWEAQSKTCVKCSGAFKIEQIGSTSNLTYTNISDVFSTACGAKTACQGLTTNASCNGETGTCNSSGKCITTPVVPISCTAAAPTITVAPNSYNGPASTQTFSISAARKDSSGCVSKSIPLIVSCTAGNTPSWTSGSTLATAYNGTGTQTVDVAITASGSCTMTAKSPDDNTKTISSTVNITVPPLACPKGSKAGSTTNFAVDFKQSTFTTSETFKISYMIPPEYEDGSICIYAPGSSTSLYSKNETSTGVPKTSSNYDTGYKPASSGLWKVTINKGSSCSSSSTCFATATVTAPSPTCNAGDGCKAIGCSSADPDCGGGGFFISSCNSCNPAGNGPCNNMSGSANVLWLAANVPTTAAKCTVDSNISNICSQESTGGFASCQVGLSNGTTCSCGGSAPPPVVICTPACTLPATCVSGACVAPPPPPTSSCSGPGFYKSPITFCNVQELITGATGWILGFVASVIILILVYGGIIYTTSAGDEERIRSAKNTILYAIIGLGIILISYSIITEVKSIFKIP